MSRALYPKVVVLFLMLGAGTALGPLARPATAQETKAFELRPGVIVDPGRKLAYIMNTKGGIDAVELARGTLVWSTDQAAKPLALNGDLLVSQVEPPGPGSALEIAILSVQERGRRRVANSIRLPADVRVSIDETLNSSFTTYARVLGGGMFMLWEYSFHPIKGTAPSDTLPDELPRTTSGAVRMDLLSGALSSLKPEEVPPGLARRPPDLAATERLVGVPGPQFIAADSGHVLGSERVADDRVWDKYRWTIYERLTGKRVAEIRNHLPQAPFVVLGSQVIYETGPYLRRTEMDLIDEPLKIRAVDLQTGQELWSWPVRDTTFRGPFPP